MGVYIKGMEMPKDGELLCINIQPDGKVCINLDLECEKVGEAVHVPPHGRLIDLDAIPKEAWRGEKEDLVDELILAPTIIPASGKEGE